MIQNGGTAHPVQENLDHKRQVRWAVTARTVHMQVHHVTSRRVAKQDSNVSWNFRVVDWNDCRVEWW